MSRRLSALFIVRWFYEVCSSNVLVSVFRMGSPNVAGSVVTFASLRSRAGAEQWPMAERSFYIQLTSSGPTAFISVRYS